MNWTARLRLGSLIALAVLFAIGWHSSFAQGEDFRYFPETDLTVSGEILSFYNKVQNAEFYFGPPISREFTDELTGRRMQYFQRVRLEINPDAESPELRVQLTPLGELLYDKNRVQSLEIPANNSACRAFPPLDPQEGKPTQVCYAFLEFFEANGGVSQFGFPISDFVFEDGRIVQYFMYAKFSWHPEFASGQRVHLSDLGRIYFYEHRENPDFQNPEDNIIGDILALKARAFTEKALLGTGDNQTLFVIVQNQSLDPVAQADVKVTMRLPDRQEDIFLLAPTDENGITQLTFPIRSDEIGMVKVEVTATFLDFQDKTETSFRIWW